MINKSRVCAYIVLFIVVGFGGIFWTQMLIRRDTKESSKVLQEKIDIATQALAQSEATDRAWRDALAQYNQKINVPQVIEPTPAPLVKEVRYPVIRPSMPVVTPTPSPTPTPKVIVKTVRVKVKVKSTPTPAPKPWYRRFDSTR